VAVELPAGVLADDVRLAGIPPGAPEVPAAELVAADTDPEKEQADNVRTASSARGTGRAARGRKLVMAPR
jgi:hypothetical protein